MDPPRSLAAFLTLASVLITRLHAMHDGDILFAPIASCVTQPSPMFEPAETPA